VSRWRALWQLLQRIPNSSTSIANQIKEARMKPVEIYTSPLCGYCHAAKRLLDQKGVTYSEVNVLEEPERKAEMIQRANGGRTVPQIFFGDTHVGGCDDLYALEEAGKLDPLLRA
jgi:glutaredoxin 3